MTNNNDKKLNFKGEKKLRRGREKETGRWKGGGKRGKWLIASLGRNKQSGYFASGHICVWTALIQRRPRVTLQARQDFKER